MNFSGFVQLRRGLIDHTRDGRLTNNEALAFIMLTMLADKSTGSYTINGPTLRSYLPELSEDAAQRVLRSLEEKRYIYRDVKPRSPLAYRYWIHRYEPTTGPYKLRQLDLTQVFETKDTSELRYVNRAVEGAVDPAVEGAVDPAVEGAHYNNKKKNKKKDKEKIPSLGKNGGLVSSTSEHLHFRPTGTQECEAPPVDSRKVQLVPKTADDGQLVPDGSLAETPPYPTRGVGLKWVNGAFKNADDPNGPDVHGLEVVRRLAEKDLEVYGDVFFCISTKAEVPFVEALELIEGRKA
jgi:hypothetical protein